MRNTGLVDVRRWIARGADAWLGARGTPEPGRAPSVVVIGGSRGIGLAIAAEFLAEGRPVVLVARTQAHLTAAKVELAKAAFGGTVRIETIALDVTGTEAAPNLAARLDTLGLHADILVLSAGVGLAGPFDSHSPVDIGHLVDVNVTSPTRLIRHFLPEMKARARGGVLVVSSLAGYIPGPNQAAYYASKAYLCSLTEAIGTELAGSGVRMTVLAPGPVETTFHAHMGAEQSFYRRLWPALSPERAACAAVWGYHVGRRVVVPGLIAKALAVCICVLPHWVTAPIVSRLLFKRVRPD